VGCEREEGEEEGEQALHGWPFALDGAG
jgi:hypothetical protein